MGAPLQLAPGEVELTLFEVPASAIVAPTPERVRATAFYHGYLSARTTLLHVLRDTPVRRYVSPHSSGADHDWGQGWCGTSATNSTRSVTVFLDPLPTQPPDGLVWCPTCLGRLAGRLGLLGVVGELLASAA